MSTFLVSSIGGGVEVDELTLLSPAGVDATVEDHARAAKRGV